MKLRTAITTAICLALAAVVHLEGSGIGQSAYNLVQDEGTPLTRLTTINCVGLGITCSTSGSVTQFNVPAASATQQHNVTFIIDGGGSAITTGALGLFPTAAYSCTINRIDVSADQSGSITVDIWKKAGAIPSAADKISASAPATLSSSQLSQNGSLTGWTTAVSSGDVFGGTIATASTVQRVTIQIWCQ